jgi:stage II sporulation protein D
MKKFFQAILSILVFSGMLLSPLCLPTAQETRARRSQNSSEDKPQPSVPAERSSVIVVGSDSKDTVRLDTEPLMRIALAVDVRAATISTAGQLLKASELDSSAEALAVSRVRIESRVLAPQQIVYRPLELEVARALSPDEADRIAELVQSVTGKSGRVEAEDGKSTVLITAHTPQEAEDITTKLEEAGFDATPVIRREKRDSQSSTISTARQNGASSESNGATPGSKLRLTAKSSPPTRELLAFAHGGAPFLRSSAPLLFASNDELNAPVRFNDKPFRGRLEVFANPRGALTVVNVIGLEDYVRGVVPNELSPGGFPALEALKAQAIAARTYAYKNRNQFASEGFDLLPTTRSQVYRGLTSEHPLASRAVNETRGVIATYNGEPINALYTSTCGGRTEDSENIFNEAVPYLRGRECAAEGKAAFAPFMIKSARDLFEIKDVKDLEAARDVAKLAVNGFSLPLGKISSEWLAAHISESEARDWLMAAARVARNSGYTAPEEATKPPAFATALVRAAFGDGRADTLLNTADVDYLLSFSDATEIPSANRADVALLVRDRHLTLFADATLRPNEKMSRSRALHSIASLLETRGSLALQKGTTRPAANGLMNLRSNKGKDQPIVVNREAFFFREFGDNWYQVKSLSLVGGEPITFHVSARGEVDYLEVRPAANGASAERFSNFSNWTTELSLGEVQSRLGRSVRGIGAITDLRVAARGSSRRVIDLEVVGTQGTGHVRRGHVRSALGLREQLFVIDRIYNDNNRVIGFVFTGRGLGHGVGMCQVGAYGLARQGYTVEQILKAYYTGIELTKLYN